MCVFNLVRAGACKPNGMPAQSRPFTFNSFNFFLIFNMDDVSKIGYSRPS